MFTRVLPKKTKHLENVNNIQIAMNVQKLWK